MYENLRGVNYATAAALLDVPDLDAAIVQWMPTIMNFNFLPDMGRMNGQWQWQWQSEDGIFYLPVQKTQAANLQLRCIA